MTSDSEFEPEDGSGSGSGSGSDTGAPPPPPDSPTSLRTVPTIASNPFADGELGRTYFTRPNRYFGPRSTWLGWTESERALAMSLDRLRAGDLALHLLNAHGVRRRGREDGAAAASASLGLPSAWTAWPMPTDEVPRDGILGEIDASAWRGRGDERPSAELEDALVATATRIARETWEARSWESADDGSRSRSQSLESGDVRMGEARDDNAREGDAADDEMSGAEDPETDGDVHAVTVTGGEDQHDNDDDDNDNDNDEDDDSQHDEMRHPTFRSLPITRDEIDSESEAAEDDDDSPSDTADRPPVPLADDDKARQLFLPSARHILANLDKLLLALHTSRASYANVTRRSRSRSVPAEPDATEGDGTSRSRGRSASRPSRKRGRSPPARSRTSNASSVGGSQRVRLNRLNQRDWSDVLGMAALTGFPPAVIERASERCARMFDQNMLFRTFHEKAPGSGARGGATYTEQLALDPEDSSLVSSSDGEAENDNEDEGAAAAAPAPTRPAVRNSLRCAQCTRNNARCDPATDEAETAAAAPCKRCTTYGITCSGISVAHVSADHNPRAKTCPHPKCTYHTIPFRGRGYLRRHLDLMHLGVAVPPRSQRRARSRLRIDVDSAGTSAVTTDTEGGMNPITCPVVGCPRSALTKPFRRRARMYEHVRRKHPDVDVAMVKRLQRNMGFVRGRGKERAQSRHDDLPSSGKEGSGGDDDDDEEFSEGGGKMVGRRVTRSMSRGPGGAERGRLQSERTEEDDGRTSGDEDGEYEDL